MKNTGFSLFFSSIVKTKNIQEKSQRLASEGRQAKNYFIFFLAADFIFFLTADTVTTLIINKLCIISEVLNLHTVFNRINNKILFIKKYLKVKFLFKILKKIYPYS